MSNKGTAVLDFGPAPGGNIATVSVTGQTGILGTSLADAWLMGGPTADHNETEHLIVPMEVRCWNVQAGVGFDIMGSSDLRLSGTFEVSWVWA